MNNKERGSFVKVQFYEKDIGYENLWATPLSDDRYRLESIPFFVYDVSLHDIVIAKPNEDGRLQFLKIAQSSGNTTLRARKGSTFSDIEQARVVNKLKTLGGEAEILNERLIAINVPKLLQLTPIIEFLSDIQLSWEFGNPSRSNVAE